MKRHEKKTLLLLKNKVFVLNILFIFATLILFILALFSKGFTHDLLLEAAVFLVSAKLILAAYSIETKLGVLKELILSLKDPERPSEESSE